jgi:hypothetical protein
MKLHHAVTGHAYKLVDHINRNGMDCRRCNLRPATSSENGWNTRKPNHYGGKPCSSIYKGVSRYRDKWNARITVHGQRIHLGVFNNEFDAAIAYNSAAVVAFGEFARLNRIPDEKPAWPTPVLEEVEYSPELRALYQQTEPRLRRI